MGHTAKFCPTTLSARAQLAKNKWDFSQPPATIQNSYKLFAPPTIEATSKSAPTAGGDAWNAAPATDSENWSGDDLYADKSVPSSATGQDASDSATHIGGYRDDGVW